MRLRTAELEVSVNRMHAPAPRLRSRRACTVAELFGLRIDSAGTVAAPVTTVGPDEFSALRWLDDLIPAPGQIVLISGPSGSGKSSLLRAIRNAARFRSDEINFRWIDLAKIHLPDRPVVDCFGRRSLTKVLEMLSRVGLAEVWTYLRTPDEISEGQRWRLRLAIALMRAASTRTCRSIIVCDEFATMLDRITAAVVARTLRRQISAVPNACSIVATSHDDLLRALVPDVIVRCDFGAVTVTRSATDH